ncbi:hydrolase 1, exosortase A system-associated [Altererythrobacter aerius]|uniref:Hydrolase 1, exosortase A system-associated n=1 Tax=Tsuneonella aeria TaxID=1837929 RepID=A0A6I4TDA3_9SPHN|nr:hydrolase 1, exosortase A system-associated [Tsuneonella aeria]MXO74165.1 hydrolase 1, exosortase A system-associated [Tsuneonella aeria]
MSRRHIVFPCGEDWLAGTIDMAPGSSGLLIVSGGGEVRSGPAGHYAALAGRLAAAGYPVFRFDRRGVGDSVGTNGGFRSAGPDIATAAAAFRAEAPSVKRLIAWGNCDGASALMLDSGAGMDGLVLSNPWVLEDDAELPVPRAVRQRYGAKLRNPQEILRLLTGKVNVAGLAKGLVHAMRPRPAPTSLAGEMAAGLARFHGAKRILIATRDRTAQHFTASWPPGDACVIHFDSASHGWIEPPDRDFLFQHLLEALKG